MSDRQAGSNWAAVSASVASPKLVVELEGRECELEVATALRTAYRRLPV